MNKIKELKVFFECNDTDMANEIIADCFYRNDITGVVFEAPVEIDDDWGDNAIVPEKYSVAGYITDNDISKIENIKEDVLKSAHILNMEVFFSLRDIKEEDWAHSWKDFFYPIEVSENIVIKPTWRNLEKDYPVIIKIDPGMAFGSGSHPTTMLCIKMLEEYTSKESNVLDIGCGSGILMIAALKLGASFATGIDNDKTAVNVSIENLQLNNISQEKYEVYQSDLTENTDKKYNLVVSNILAEIIVELIPDLSKVSATDTKFIFSGIIKEKKSMVIEKMKEFNLVPEKIYEDSGWISISGNYR